MNSLGISGHIETDTRFRVTPFPDSAHPFVSLGIQGDFIQITLIAAPGTSESLRNLAAAALEAAGVLDAIATDGPEVAA